MGIIFDTITIIPSHGNYIMGRSRAGSGSRHEVTSEAPLPPIVGRYPISKRLDIVGHNWHIGSHHIATHHMAQSRDPFLSTASQKAPLFCYILWITICFQILIHRGNRPPGMLSIWMACEARRLKT